MNFLLWRIEIYLYFYILVTLIVIIDLDFVFKYSIWIWIEVTLILEFIWISYFEILITVTYLDLGVKLVFRFAENWFWYGTIAFSRPDAFLNYVLRLIMARKSRYFKLAWAFTECCSLTCGLFFIDCWWNMNAS